MEFFFHRVYEMADLVATTIENEAGVFDELDWSSPDITRCLSRFSKTSLLGHFCFAIIRRYHVRAYRKDPEIFDECHIQLTEEALARWRIPFTPFKEFLRRTFTQQEIDDPDSGSSVISRAHNQTELTAAMLAALEF